MQFKHGIMKSQIMIMTVTPACLAECVDTTHRSVGYNACFIYIATLHTYIKLYCAIHSHISRMLHVVIVQTQGQSLKSSVNDKDIHKVKSK